MSCSTTTTVLPASTRRVQLAHQQLDVGGVQPGGRLVEQVERVPAPGPLELRGQLDPLRLAAGQLGRRLPEREIAQPDVEQRRRGCGTTAGTSAKKPAASSTVIASTSATDRPR